MTPATPVAARSIADQFSSARRCLVAAAFVASATVLLGCDDVGQGEAYTLAARAAAVRTVGAEADSDLVSALGEAAQRTRPDGATILAKSAFARLKLDQAARSAAEVASLQADAERLLYQIGSLARRADVAADLASTYQSFDPAKSIAALEASAAAARGDGNAAQFAADVANSSIPTLAVVEQNKSQLDAQIAEAESKRTQLVERRDSQLASAGDLSTKADQSRGDARVDLVTQAAAARTQAAEASRELAAAESTLERLKADAAVQLELQKQLSAAAETLAGQAKSLKSGWQEITTSAASLTELSKQIVQGNGKNAVTIKSLAAELDETMKAVNEKFEATDSLYKEAIASFDSASQVAGRMLQDIGAAKAGANAPYEAGAWETEAKLFAADRLNVEKGYAQLDHARVLARQAQLVGHAAEVAAPVAEVAKSIGVSPVASLDVAKLTAATKESTKAADEAFAEAVTTFEGVTASDESLAGLRVAFQTGRVLGRYEHARLAAYAKSVGVEPSIAADKLLADAKAAAEEARDSNVVLPLLPESIRAAARPAQPAEGVTPPADGGTTPAEGAAPAAESATPPAEPTEAAAPEPAPTE